MAYKTIIIIIIIIIIIKVKVKQSLDRTTTGPEISWRLRLLDF